MCPLTSSDTSSDILVVTACCPCTSCIRGISRCSSSRTCSISPQWQRSSSSNRQPLVQREGGGEGHQALQQLQNLLHIPAVAALQQQ